MVLTYNIKQLFHRRDRQAQRVSSGSSRRDNNTITIYYMKITKCSNSKKDKKKITDGAFVSFGAAVTALLLCHNQLVQLYHLYLFKPI